MGLWQKALETYDNFFALDVDDRTDRSELTPIAHNVTKANVEITVDENGCFVSAIAIPKEDAGTVIPVTEKSAGRTSGPEAHPLCDNLKFISPVYDDCHIKYVNGLTDWVRSEFSHPIIKAVLIYVQSGKILDDLEREGLFSNDLSEKDLKDKLKTTFVRWRVNMADQTQETACWKNKTLFQKWIEYYSNSLNDLSQEICMLTGEKTIIAAQHPKGVIPIHGNAKLISANDTSGFTYRGRFLDDKQAGGIGYVSSQKAHSALRWLIANQGVTIANRTYVAWNPKGYAVPSVSDPFGFDEEPALKPTDFQSRLASSLNRYRTDLPDHEDVVIACFDAATTGRLAMTYYNEVNAMDFLSRLKEWDEWCCWFCYGKIVSPSLRRIVEYAFGTEQGQFIKCDDRIMAQHLQSMIACRAGGGMIPADVVGSLFRNASNPQHYSQQNYELVLATACAVIRKNRHERKGDDLEMALEIDKKDRSYQYGRLLAVMEKAEKDTYSAGDGRETNAVRMQAVFSQRPFYASSRIMEQLKRSYLRQLPVYSRSYYEKLFGQIYEKLSEFPESELNRPLADTYLIGYYLQRNDLYTSRKNTEEDE